MVFYQAKSAEDQTPSGRLRTTILSYHHKIRSSPAVLLHGLLAELGMSDLSIMDNLEDILQALTPMPHEELGTFLWRAQVALADYNKAAPSHGLFLRILPFLLSDLGDLLLPELRVIGRDYLPLPLLFRILHDRIRLDAASLAAPLHSMQMSAPALRLVSLGFFGSLGAVPHDTCFGSGDDCTGVDNSTGAQVEFCIHYVLELFQAGSLS